MPYEVVDLFCGVGGLTCGLRQSGLRVVAGFDNDKTCEYTYSHNNHTEFHFRNIREVNSDEINACYSANAKKILVGCAPCQPFSAMSYKRFQDSSRELDEKYDLLSEFGRLIKEVQPVIVSMENVPELSTQTVFRDFVNVLQELDYNVNWNVVYCPEYGVPQNRKRLVLLASRLGQITLMQPLYNQNNYPTVRDAIGWLPPINAGEQYEVDPLHQACRLSEINMRRIQSSVPGGTWRDWDVSLQLPCHRKKTGKTYPAVYGRMSWDEPSPTITTQFFGYGNGRFGHPDQDRALSLREGAILQSFPPDYVFIDEDHPASRRDLGIHIGNAVPVELGRAIGVSILNHLREVGLDG